MFDDPALPADDSAEHRNPIDLITDEFLAQLRRGDQPEVGEFVNGDLTIANIWDRLQRFGDLFAPVVAGGQTLDAAEEALGIRT